MLILDAGGLQIRQNRRDNQLENNKTKHKFAMLKKTYISPELKAEQAEPSVIIAVSVTVDRSGSVDAEDVETKGAVTDVNVWDKEW